MKYTILNNKIEVSLQKHIDSINTFRPHLKHTIDQSLKHCGGRGDFIMILTTLDHFCVHYLPGPPVKQGAALLLGLIISIATCGIHTLHSFFTVLGTWLIIKISWR